MQRTRALTDVHNFSIIAHLTFSFLVAAEALEPATMPQPTGVRRSFQTLFFL
jgi:hypothetical protein